TQLEYFCVAADTDDGKAFRTDTVYPPGGSTNSITGGNLTVQRAKSGSNYIVEPALLRFDTTTLPPGATINSASLFLKGAVAADANALSLQGEWYDQANWPIDPTDYADVPAATAFSVLEANLVGGDNTISLASVSGITPGGYTGMRLHLSAATPTG